MFKENCSVKFMTHNTQELSQKKELLNALSIPLIQKMTVIETAHSRY